MKLFFPKSNSNVLVTSENHPTCLLDGHCKQTRYYAASQAGARPYSSSVFKHMGDGVVGFIRGVRQPGHVRLSFLN